MYMEKRIYLVIDFTRVLVHTNSPQACSSLLNSALEILPFSLWRRLS